MQPMSRARVRARGGNSLPDPCPRGNQDATFAIQSAFTRFRAIRPLGALNPRRPLIRAEGKGSPAHEERLMKSISTAAFAAAMAAGATVLAFAPPAFAKKKEEAPAGPQYTQAVAVAANKAKTALLAKDIAGAQ